MTFKRFSVCAMALLLALSFSGVSAMAESDSTVVSAEAFALNNCRPVVFEFSYYTDIAASADSLVTRSYTCKSAEQLQEEQLTGEIAPVRVTLGDLEIPAPKSNAAVFVGWSAVRTAEVCKTESDAQKTEGFLTSDADITKQLSNEKGFTLYPVFREKTQAEIAAEAAEEQKAEKIAVDENGVAISAAKVNVRIKALPGEQVADALKASGANAANAALYDISVTDSNGKSVTLIEGKNVTVSLERPMLDGKVAFKLYHIDGDKAEEVAISVGDDAITFENSEFSPYVLTWSILPAGDGSNPPTGDNLNVGLLIVIAVVALGAGIAVVVLRNRSASDDDDGDGSDKAVAAKTAGAVAAGAKPANAGAKPANAGAKPANGGARPANNGARPANNGARPANNGARPANNGARPANNGAKPANGNARPANPNANRPTNPNGNGGTKK